jgi:hypothetical protein
MRYSTETGNPGIDDRIPQHRGLGMKVFNVKGDMFDVGKGISLLKILSLTALPRLRLQTQRQRKKYLSLRHEIW